MEKDNNSDFDQSAVKPACEQLLTYAKAYGAQQAEVICVNNRSLGVSVRENALEDIDASEGLDIGLRVINNHRQACVSGSDLSDSALEKLAERCTAMAKLAPTDPYCGLAEPEQVANKEQLANKEPELELYDAAELNADTLLKRALVLEKTALSVDKIVQAEGSSASFAKSAIWFATSNGFSGGWLSSRHSLSVAAFASDGNNMERDYEYKTARWLEDLEEAETIALKAARRAKARLGARQMQSTSGPVLLDRRIATQILSGFVSVISGTAIARGNSFLKDKMGEQIFAKNINIIDDPYIKRGIGSRPWDGEGIAGKRMGIVKNGILQTWLLHLASARQLGLASTGHASRPISSPPAISSSNIWIEPGQKSPVEIMSYIKNGLLVTEMFGPSFNSNTGDYSVGIAGFEIIDGQKAGPVSEITIAANMLDMFKTMQAANDFERDKAMSCPSLLIENMVISGG